MNYIEVRIFAAVLIGCPVITHGPLDGAARVQHSQDLLILSRGVSFSVFLCCGGINICNAQLLTETEAMLSADFAPLVLLVALVAVEFTTRELARKLIWVVLFSLAVLKTALAAAVTIVEVALCFVVFSVAGAITQPYFHALYGFGANFLLRYYFFQNKPAIIAIINRRWNRKHVIWKNFGIGSPTEAETLRSAHCENQQ